MEGREWIGQVSQEGIQPAPTTPGAQLARSGARS
jgi:hypothetical protein